VQAVFAAPVESISILLQCGPDLPRSSPINASGVLPLLASLRQSTGCVGRSPGGVQCI
jgi:hypothetical protein